MYQSNVCQKVTYADIDEEAETQLQPLWKVCLGDKIPLKERVDDVVFSLMVRGRNGILSQRCLTDAEKWLLNWIQIF